jgi:ankyrin repeat protein
LAKIYALVEQMIKLETRIDEAPLFDIPNDKGQTPLIIAVEKRRNEVVDYLVEAGASPNTHKTIGDKDAPLHYAATRGLMKIVQVYNIIEFLAWDRETDISILQRLCSYAHTNLNAINGIGLTPLLCAFKTHGLIDEETRSIVSNIGVIQLLLKHGADPTIAVRN